MPFSPRSSHAAGSGCQSAHGYSHSAYGVLLLVHQIADCEWVYHPRSGSSDRVHESLQSVVRRFGWSVAFNRKVNTEVSTPNAARKEGVRRYVEHQEVEHRNNRLRIARAYSQEGSMITMHTNPASIDEEAVLVDTSNDNMAHMR